MFEQASDVLEKRFGFRVVEYGLRMSTSGCRTIRPWRGSTWRNLRDWRGEATILPPRLKYESNPGLFNGSPVVRWWRHSGDTAVAMRQSRQRGACLIEKPGRGNFLP